jgi:hypothetical protein
MFCQYIVNEINLSLIFCLEGLDGGAYNTPIVMFSDLGRMCLEFRSGTKPVGLLPDLGNSPEQ